MAKKFYLNDAAAAYNPAVAKGAWDDTTNQPDIGQLGSTPSGAYATLGVAETSTTNNWDVLLATFVSDALLNPVSFLTTDVFTGVLSVLESSASANDFTHIHIWVTTGNTDTVRGTLINDYINATEWPTTTAGQVIIAKKLANNVSALAGDHIVIEIGYQAQNTSGTSFTGTLGFGTNGPTSDLSDGDTSVTVDPSWVSFSSNFGAEVVLLGSTFDTNSGTHTVTATPQQNDLIVIITACTGNTSTSPPTDNGTNGATYVAISGASALKNTSADLLQAFVRPNFIQYKGVSTTFTHAPGASTGGGLAVYAIRGIAKVNTAAIRQAAAQANHASGSAPAPTFSSSVLTGNPVISAVFNGTNPPGLTAKSGYTRDLNTGYATPTTGIDTMSITSGETGTAITWGSSSASAFSSIAIEFDMSITTLQNQTDTFPGSSLDATLWYDNTQSGGTQSVSSSAVHLTAPALTANALAEVETQNRYDLTGSYAFVKAVVTQVADANAEAGLTVYIDEYGNQLQMTISNSNLIASYLLAGVTTTLSTTAYNSSTHAWIRIRESSGTIFWDYSSDGLNWTNLTSIATPMSITMVRSSVLAFDANSNATNEVGVFSSYNTAPSSTSHNLTLLGVGS